MANDNLKKFLDAAGVSHLWGKINEQIDADVKVEADRAKAEEQRIEAKFGALGTNEDGSAKTVKQYVDAKTENIATNDVVTGINTRLGVVEADYVKHAEIADFATDSELAAVEGALNQYKTDNDAALAGVKATADAAAVKTEVEAALALKADSSAVYSKDEVDGFIASAKKHAEDLIAAIDIYDGEFTVE